MSTATPIGLSFRQGEITARSWTTSCSRVQHVAEPASQGPQNHLSKLAFERYYLWKVRKGYVQLP